MPDKDGRDNGPDNGEEKRRFIYEKIVRPRLSKTQIVKRLLFLGVSAVLFGALAAVTFVVSAPLAKKYLVEEETEESSTISIPKDEPETTTDESVPYFEKVFAHALALDPQKRPRTIAEIKNSGPYICKCHQFSDFICLNRYYGWYIKGGYEIFDAFEDFRVDEMEMDYEVMRG